MRHIGRVSAVFGVVFVFTLVVALTTTRPSAEHADGQQIFPFDPFTDEQLWTNVLRMHEVVSTLDPATALGVELKVDVDMLPPPLIAAFRANQVDLNAVTTALIRLNAVVGVKGRSGRRRPIDAPDATCSRSR
jgi:hypothetical protein